MLRLLFWILIIANGALFAYHQGYFGSPQEKREPQRMLSQANADKLKLLSASAASAPSPEPTQQPAPESAASQAALACLEIGNFAPGEAKRVEERLAGLALGQNKSRIAVQEVASHMVYIPPLGGKEAADRKVAELKRLGIKNFFVISEAGPYRWGISLGVFKSEQAAKNQLAELNRQGVRGARIGPRTVSTDKVLFRLRNLDPSSAQAVDKIMADFPEQKKQECSHD